MPSFRRRTDVPFTIRQKVFYTLRLIISKGVAAHRSTPNQVDPMNHLANALGIPPDSNRSDFALAYLSSSGQGVR
jgi:hypothetical protein